MLAVLADPCGEPVPRGESAPDPTAESVPHPTAQTGLQPADEVVARPGNGSVVLPAAEVAPLSTVPTTLQPPVDVVGRPSVGRVEQLAAEMVARSSIEAVAQPGVEAVGRSTVEAVGQPGVEAVARLGVEAVLVGRAEPLTPLVGRDAEIAALLDLVRASRLVSLVGPGGSGKTRLGRAVGERLAGDRHRTWWVPLAQLDSAEMLVATVADALGVPETPGRRAPDAVVAHLRAHPGLLVLDNCEHLVAACAALVAGLLRACPQLQVLTTSREPLAVAGETTWWVQGLSLPPDRPQPTAAELAGSEAVRLFADRAQLIRPGFEVTDGNAADLARLCRRLDGMPLALELAAARLRVLPLPRIVARLDDAISLLATVNRDVPARQATIRTALDWSHDLLPEQERDLFARLSVFRGEFTLPAAEAVAQGSAGAPDTLDLLARLVDKSLVQACTDGAEERYRLLEVVRQYAAERLGERHPAVSALHAQYMLGLAVRAEAGLGSGEQQLWLGRLHRDRDNLRAALAWARRGDPRLEVELAAALGHYWRLSGQYAEGRQWLSAAVAAVAAVAGGTPLVADGGIPPVPDGGIPLVVGAGPALEAGDGTALVAGGVALVAGDGTAVADDGTALEAGDGTALVADGGPALASGGVTVLVAEGRTPLVPDGRVPGPDRDTPAAMLAKALAALGTLEFLHCEYAAADVRLRRARELYAAAGDERGVAATVQRLGSIAREQGRYAEAWSHHRDGRRLWERLGDPAGLARALKGMGFTAWLEGDHARAVSFSTEALRRFREVGDTEGAVGALIDLAAATHRGGDPETAEALLAECLAIAEPVGLREAYPWATEQLGLIAAARGDRAQAVTLLRRSLSAHHELGDRWRTAGVLDALAGLCADAHAAARLLAAADRQRREIGTPVPPCDLADHDRRVRAVAAALSPADLDRATTRGRTLTLDEAVEAATQESFGSAAQDSFGLAAQQPIESVAQDPTGPAVQEPAGPAVQEPAGPAVQEPAGPAVQEPAGPAVQEPAGPAVPEPGKPSARKALTVRALGRGAVAVGDRELGPEDWTYAKPRELLHHMLISPGATKAEIGLALWPEASGAELRNSFHTCLKFLRKAVGEAARVRFAGGAYHLEPLASLDYDVAEFRAAVAAAREETGAIVALTAAAARYDGDFLAGAAVGAWAEPYREELRRDYENVLRDLGGALGRERRFVEAADVFARMVTHDPLLETAHRGLMRCYAALGDRARALRHYDDLSRLLDARVGASPAPETIQLYLQIRGRAA